MQSDDPSMKDQATSGPEYDDLLDLEELESLLEELEEEGITGDISPDRLPSGLAERTAALGVRNTAELRERISTLHSQMDREDYR